MLVLALLLAAAPARAADRAVYTATLTLDPGGPLRAVETLRPLDGALCGPFARDLPAKTLRLDGLRRLSRVRVAGAFRGAGAGLRPAAWRLERTPRGVRAVVAAAPAPPDCAVVLMTESEPLLAAGPAGARLRFPLPTPGPGAVFESVSVSLAGSGAAARLVRRASGAESALAEGSGAVALTGAADAGSLVFVADLPEATTPPAPGARRLLADNLHVAAGAAGLLVLLAFYGLSPVPASFDGRPWPLLAAGAGLSAGTAAAMRLAEDPAGIGPGSAAWALAAGAGAALAGAAALACWGLTVVLMRSAQRPGSPRPGAYFLAAVAAGFLSFGATTMAADLFTRLVRDAAPAGVLVWALHLLAHAGAFRLKRLEPSVVKS